MKDSVILDLEPIRAAQRRWHRTPLRERLDFIRRLRHLLVDNALALAGAAALPRQRPVAEALAGEVIPLADACRFLERRAASLLAPVRLGSRGRPLWLRGMRAEIHREPLGLVLVIGPFNYPLFLPGVQTLQALAAGNAVLLKPGLGGGSAARALSEIARTAGLDPDLVRVLPETPEAAQAAMNAGVDKVVLTGSAETGAVVLSQLAPRLVPATMELSGSDAVIVRDDADLDLVTRALAFGLRWNAGATCIAPRRVIVAEARAAELERRLGQAIAALPPRLLAGRTNEVVIAGLRDAVAKGARLHGPTVSAEGTARVPVLIANAGPEMGLWREAVFAPMLVLAPVRGDDEAIALASACPYALGASVFSRNSRAARAVAERLRVGVVTINDVIVPTADPRLPFGGRGRSGFGVTRGPQGLLEMTAIKVVTQTLGPARPHFQELAEGQADLLTAGLTILHGRNLLQRLRALVALVAVALKTLLRASGGIRPGERDSAKPPDAAFPTPDTPTPPIRTSHHDRTHS